MPHIGILSESSHNRKVSKKFWNSTFFVKKSLPVGFASNCFQPFSEWNFWTTSAAGTEFSALSSLSVLLLLHFLLYRVGQKTGSVWALITQQWLLAERRVIRQKFQNAVKKRQICIVKHLNVLCLICINIRHPRNSVKFDSNTWI